MPYSEYKIINLTRSQARMQIKEFFDSLPLEEHNFNTEQMSEMLSRLLLRFSNNIKGIY